MLERYTLVNYDKGTHREIGRLTFTDEDGEERYGIELNSSVERRHLIPLFRDYYDQGILTIDHEIVNRWLRARMAPARPGVVRTLQDRGYSKWTPMNMTKLNQGFSDNDSIYVKELYQGGWNFELWAHESEIRNDSNQATVEKKKRSLPSLGSYGSHRFSAPDIKRDVAKRMIEDGQEISDIQKVTHLSEADIQEMK